MHVHAVRVFLACFIHTERSLLGTLSLICGMSCDGLRNSIIRLNKFFRASIYKVNPTPHNNYSYAQTSNRREVR